MDSSATDPTWLLEDGTVSFLELIVLLSTFTPTSLSLRLTMMASCSKLARSVSSSDFFDGQKLMSRLIALFVLVESIQHESSRVRSLRRWRMVARWSVFLSQSVLTDTDFTTG